MPELPEVEAIRQNLKSRLQGWLWEKTIFLRIRPKNPHSTREISHIFSAPESIGSQPSAQFLQDFFSNIQGKTLSNIYRRGKYLYFSFNQNYGLLAHLRMAGSFLIDLPPCLEILRAKPSQARTKAKNIHKKHVLPSNVSNSSVSNLLTEIPQIPQYCHAHLIARFSKPGEKPKFLIYCDQRFGELIPFIRLSTQEFEFFKHPKHSKQSFLKPISEPEPERSHSRSRSRSLIPAKTRLRKTAENTKQAPPAALISPKESFILARKHLAFMLARKRLALLGQEPLEIKTSFLQTHFRLPRKVPQEATSAEPSKVVSLKNKRIEEYFKQKFLPCLHEAKPQRPWPNIPIHRFLLMQQHLVGIGNIYANEALFLASIHPLQAVSSLSSRQRKALASALFKILNQAILKKGSSLAFLATNKKMVLKQSGSRVKKSSKAQPKKPWRCTANFMLPDGSSGSYAVEELKVYGANGKTCPRCHSEKSSIKKLSLANRSIYFCPACQLLPGSPAP